MIICSNCGATNNEANSNICRKCGALLPLSTKPPRVKIKTKEKKSKKSTQTNEVEVRTQELDLQEIPLSEFKESLKSIDKITELEDGENDEFYEEMEAEEKEVFLQEIKPRPFQGSIITDNKIYGSLVPKKARESIPVPKKDKTSKQSAAIIRQKQLEEEMTKVLRFLSNKITVKELPPQNVDGKKIIAEKKQDSFVPLSMNQILEDLLKLDVNIEASAIIKSDGMILASAISSRISDSLFAAIGQNLTMIGTDIINGLSAGKLKSISLRGSKGVLDLAPISDSNDMLLLIFSNPKIQSGIIFLAAKNVKKQVREYLGISKK
jgi:predicted regulator of Ras-like GTPase activity (Roadblock/LC7/MglB family)/ribosomal protein L40E